MNLITLNDNLSTKLSLLKHKISIESSTNSLNLNVLLESTVARLSNVIYNTNLINANLIKPNFPAVDLVDDENRIIIQVTATGSTDKILKTLESIKKNKLSDKYNKLYFYILGDTRKLPVKSIEKINKAVPKGLVFNPKEHIYDFNSIYRQLFQEQNPSKSLKVLDILNSLLGHLPDSKTTGFESVSVCFSDENNNAYSIVENLLSRGINVYISSKKLYQAFKDKNHGLIDYLILYKSKTKLDYVRYTIVLLDKFFVENNGGMSNIKCNLLSQALAFDNKVELVNYDNNVSIDLIANKNFRNWINVSKENLKEKLDEILSDFFEGTKTIQLSATEVSRELEKVYPNFILKKEISHPKELKYSFLKFTFESLPEMSCYYLLLEKGYVLGEVKLSLRQDYKFPRNRLVVLVPRNPQHKTNRSIDKIKTELECENVHYVSDHLFDKMLKKDQTEKLLEIEDFVPPIIKRGETQFESVNAITSWVNSYSKSSVAIISGQGGLGKTTVCKRIHDSLINTSDNYHVVFIDSNSLLKETDKLEYEDELDYNLYNLYQMNQISMGFDNILDKGSFDLNYELGNIIIIFDGIDELISTLPNFTLDSFLKNISRIEKKIGRGKIIINCRDSYVRDFSYQSNEELKHLNIDHFELQPFNRILANQYFSQHFTSDKKQKTCQKLLDQFIKNEAEIEEYIYPPFVVEVVKIFVEKDFDSEDLDETFESKYLNELNSNDLIVYKICYREIIKKEERGFSLSVDSQIEFMIEMTSDFNGKIKESDFIKILTAIGQNDRKKEIARWLKDHPFFIFKNGNYLFRFDFLISFFKSLLVIQILEKEKSTSIGIHAFQVISEDLEYYSQVSRNLLEAIRNDLPYYLNSVKTLVKNIWDNNGSIDLETKRKATSNLFMLIVQAVGIDKKDKIKEVFEVIFIEKNVVQNFHLIDPPKSKEFILNFSNLIISNSSFINFHNLPLCIFNEDSFFSDSCYIKQKKGYLHLNLNSDQYTIKLKYFDSNIGGDSSLYNLLSEDNNEIIRIRKQSVNRSVQLFLKCFYKGRKWQMVSTIKDIRNRYSYTSSPVEFGQIVLLMSLHELLKEDGSLIKLNSNYKSKFAKYLEQGLNFHPLNEFIKDLNKVVYENP